MPTLFVDDLTNLDCSILDPARGLIGASWAVDVELSGELDEQSMVFDFSKVKKTIKRVIDEEVDHKLLIPVNYNGIAITKPNDTHIVFNDQDGNTIEHASPDSALCYIDSDTVTASDIITFLTERMLAVLPNNVSQCQITLREESVAGHYFCYSHGLKKHDGNCQRIAHGHRSQIQIWQDGKRNSHLEGSLAGRWSDIYLGSQADIDHQGSDNIAFRYSTDQGHFYLKLPNSRVHLMPNDSTIECIAEHIIDVLSETTNGDLKVRAFEGIGKGAIATNTAGD